MASCVALLTFLVACLPAARAAEADYVFDATLSLTGDCATSELDPVPDPGCPGGNHPPQPFQVQIGVAVDNYGNRYVASRGTKEDGSEGRIDIFSSKGEYLTELRDPNFPGAVAVDSAGNLYVTQMSFGGGPPPNLVRYSPTVYKPQSGEIEYGAPPTAIGSAIDLTYPGVAVDPDNGHVFFGEDDNNQNSRVLEYGSAAEGNPLIAKIGEGDLHGSSWLAVDAVRKRLYVTTLLENPDSPNFTGPNPRVVKVFQLEAPHALLAIYDGSDTPAGGFATQAAWALPVAVDEETGRILVGDLDIAVPKVYELAEDGGYISTIARKGMALSVGQMIVDNSGASATHGYLFVPSGGVPGHSLAFAPNRSRPPVVESVFAAGIGVEEAVLHAKINPGGEQTQYRFEYVTQQSFEENGFTGAVLAGEGAIASGDAEGVPVAVPVTGLAPGAVYHVRVVAEDKDGQDEAQASFATYRPLDPSLGCQNEALRVGASAGLPDCRAYELVTPPDTNGRAPLGITPGDGSFANTEVSASGSAVSFRIQGGGLPGLAGGIGSLLGDPYVTSRTENGWRASYAGPSGSEATSVSDRGHSADQGYLFWTAEGEGSAVVESSATSYLRYPDGHSELIGRGNLGTDPRAHGDLISEGARHVVFESYAHLEEGAAPSGTDTVYDRTIDQASGIEQTRVVSLLPEDVTPAAKEDAKYAGASLDGEGIAFTFSRASSLYLRYRDSKTYAIGENVAFAGVAEGGGRIFYVKGGDLYAFNVQGEETIRFTSSGDVTLVNVSAHGTTAYFVSPTALQVEPSPSGALPVSGGENLYRSREGAIAFVGTVTKEDVEGEPTGYGEIEGLGGLGRWLGLVGVGNLGLDPSRATPDGNVMLFESRADLAGYDPQGHAEVYRYDALHGELVCLSCNPTLAPATGQATLQTVSIDGFASRVPLSAADVPATLRADGRRAFFESTEALVPADADGLQDVYEWEDMGVGSCRTVGGCIYLISSGKSTEPNYIYAVSASGADVFIEGADLLTGEDTEEAPSVYDVRENGGFAPPSVPGECLGEACQPTAIAPIDATPASLEFSGHGNTAGGEANKKPSCPRGKRLVKRKGKLSCLVRRAKRSKGHGKHRHRHGHVKGRAHR